MFTALNIVCTPSFAEAASLLAKYWSGTYSVLRAPNEMADLWIEKRLAPVIDSLPSDFLADYQQWQRSKRDEEGGFVIHVLVDAYVPECMLGMVLAHINENDVTDRAWTIPGMQVVAP